MKDYITISITSNDLGKRIDSLISGKLKNISRNRLKSLISEGHLCFNKKVLNQPSFKLKECGELLLKIPKPKEYKLVPQNLNLNIIYEDKNLIVVDKEPGLVVHPGSGNMENTLVNALLFHCKNNLSGIGGIMRPGVVHRIDKMTSGLIVFAKDDFTHNSLSQQFKKKVTKREYALLAWNSAKNDEGEIKTKLLRSKFNRKKMAVTNSDKGKTAITKYKLIKSFDINEQTKISYFLCTLLTGRTHQIRVHMSAFGNPLIGDKKYSRNNNFLGLPEHLKEIVFNKFVKIERHALHARKLGFFHPYTKKNLLFESKLPSDFSSLLNSLNSKILDL